MAESEIVAELCVEDVVCELSEENTRLSKQLLFANKCLLLLSKYRNHLSIFTINCSCVHNTEFKSKYYDMEDEYSKIVSEIDDVNHTKSDTSDARIKKNNNKIQVISFDNNKIKKNTNSNEPNILTNNNNSSNSNNDNCDEDMSEHNNDGNNSNETDNKSVATRICFTKNSDKNKNKSINRTFRIEAISGSKPSTTQTATPLPKAIAYYNDYDDFQDLCHISIEEFDSSVSRSNDNIDYRTQIGPNYDQRLLLNDSYANLNKPIYCFNPKCYKNLGHIKGEPKRRHLKTEQCIELKPYTCNVADCNMRFKSVYYLNRHSVTHTDDKPYSCDFPTCSATFKSLESVSRHKKIHNQEKRFHCEFCDNRFARNSHLKEHIDCVHFNYRLFVCDICDLSFKRKTQLNKHRLRHNREDDEMPTVEMSNDDDN